MPLDTFQFFGWLAPGSLSGRQFIPKASCLLGGKDYTITVEFVCVVGHGVDQELGRAGNRDRPFYAQNSLIEKTFSSRYEENAKNAVNNILEGNFYLVRSVEVRVFTYACVFSQTKGS
jgi:hypothetical protein